MLSKSDKKCWDCQRCKQRDRNHAKGSRDWWRAILCLLTRLKGRLTVNETCSGSWWLALHHWRAKSQLCASWLTFRLCISTALNDANPCLCSFRQEGPWTCGACKFQQLDKGHGSHDATLPQPANLGVDLTQIQHVKCTR